MVYFDLGLYQYQTRIIKIYYHRFEIEETFKDLKHVLDLSHTRLSKPLSLKLLLLFSLLAFILAYLADWKAAARNPKKQLSWLRQYYEAIQRACLGPPAAAITGGL